MPPYKTRRSVYALYFTLLGLFFFSTGWRWIKTDRELGVADIALAQPSHFGTKKGPGVQPGEKVCTINSWELRDLIPPYTVPRPPIDWRKSWVAAVPEDAAPAYRAAIAALVAVQYDGPSPGSARH